MAGLVGVLALQGGFLEHIRALCRLGVEASPVRLPRELEEVKGLVIPGGESTTISRLLESFHLAEPIKERAQKGMPLWGTCAGMIVIAESLADHRPEPLHLLLKRDQFLLKLMLAFRHRLRMVRLRQRQGILADLDLIAKIDMDRSAVEQLTIRDPRTATSKILNQELIALTENARVPA